MTALAILRQDAQDAMAAAILEREMPTGDTGPDTLGVAAARYVKAKEAGRKRTLRNDRFGIARLRRS